MKILHWFYPSLVGFLLGLLQTGLFFQLSFTLSSSFRTFLLITICWLIGSVIGIKISKKVDFSLNSFVLLCLCAYILCAVLLSLAPFNTNLWWLYAVFITLTGLYPGVFFVRLSDYYSARQLFFRENNGFVIGLIVSTLLFLVLGRIVLWAMPLSIACLVMICTQVYFKNDIKMTHLYNNYAKEGTV